MVKLERKEWFDLKKKHIATGLSLLLSAAGIAVGAFSGQCEREEMEDAMEKKWKQLTSIKPEKESEEE